MLSVDAIQTCYGTFQALRDVSLEVDAGEVVTILGANGSGKTTLLRTISGLVSPASGSIQFNGERIDRVAPDAIVKLGISLCPEGRMLFPEMTVQKNLELGAYVHRREEGPYRSRGRKRCTSFFPGSRKGENRLRAPCPAVSSRCSP